MSQYASEPQIPGRWERILGEYILHACLFFMLHLPHTISSHHSQDSGTDGLLVCSTAATSHVFKQFPFSDCKGSFNCIFLQYTGFKTKQQSEKEQVPCSQRYLNGFDLLAQAGGQRLPAFSQTLHRNGKSQCDHFSGLQLDLRFHIGEQIILFWGGIESLHKLLWFCLHNLVVIYTLWMISSFSNTVGKSCEIELEP